MSMTLEYKDSSIFKKIISFKESLGLPFAAKNLVEKSSTSSNNS